ncbi:MAG: NAD-dependent epimerase/dehydratase family protein [Anaerolineae bacterium]
MSTERVAVIGGTGFLGSNLVLQLLEAGYTPVAIARRPERIAKVLPGIEVEARYGDLVDIDSLRSALRGCNAVYCVAAMMQEIYTSRNPNHREDAIRTNVQGTMNALRAAVELGTRRAVVTSTSATRYQRDGSVANEDSPPTDPNIIDDAYVRSKLREHPAVAAFARETGLEVVTILPGGFFGPGLVADSMMGRGVLDIINGRLPVSLDGAFQFTDVRDVAHAHLLAMERGMPGRDYLVVATTLPLRDFFGYLSRLTDMPEPRVYLPGGLMMGVAYMTEMIAGLRGGVPTITRGMLKHTTIGQRFDCSRAQQELGVTFRPVEATLRDTVVSLVERGLAPHLEERMLWDE